VLCGCKMKGFSVPFLGGVSSKDSKTWMCIYMGSMVFWLAITTMRETLNRDALFMRKRPFSFCNCNMWCIGHFLQYMLIGMLTPQFAAVSAGIGIAFEFVEAALSKRSKFCTSKIIDDPITNCSGLALGMIIGNIGRAAISRA
jgi:hypothetical protein